MSLVLIVRLVTDLDDPFGYDGGTYEAGGIEIDPYAIVDHKNRLPERLKRRTDSGVHPGS